VDLFLTKKEAAFHKLTTKTNVLLTGILFRTKADVVRAIGIEYRERDSNKATKDTLVEPRANTTSMVVPFIRRTCSRCVGSEMRLLSMGCAREI